MSMYSRMLRRIGGARWFATVASRAAPAADRIVYRLSGRRRLATPPAVPTLFLTTTGRTSGRRRRVAVSYVESDGDFLVVGTNWGKPTTPDWVLNLEANPRADIEVPGGKESPVTATRVEGSEADGMWRRFESMWPAYAAYRRRAGGREIAMFRLSAEPGVFGVPE